MLTILFFVEYFLEKIAPRKYIFGTWISLPPISLTKNSGQIFACTRTHTHIHIRIHIDDLTSKKSEMQNSLEKNISRLNEILTLRGSKIWSDNANKPQHDFISIYTVMQSTHTMSGGSIFKHNPGSYVIVS